MRVVLKLYPIRNKEFQKTPSMKCVTCTQSSYKQIVTFQSLRLTQSSCLKVQLDFFLMSALEFLSANKRIQCWGTLSNLGALSNKIPTEKPSSNLPPYLLGGSCVHSVFGKQCKHLKQFCLFSFIFFWAEKKTWLCKGSESKSLLA